MIYLDNPHHDLCTSSENNIPQHYNHVNMTTHLQKIYSDMSGSQHSLDFEKDFKKEKINFVNIGENKEGGGVKEEKISKYLKEVKVDKKER